jgi:hypothetical protein
MCLLHVEHIHGQDPDPQAAIRLAKKMIRDGRMPTPEEALSRLQERQERGAPIPMPIITTKETTNG